MNILELKERHPKKFKATYRTWVEGEGNPDWNWYDSIIEDAVEVGKERGFFIDDRSNERGRTAFYFNGFWSQGDGASWTGSVNVHWWVEWLRANNKPLPFDDMQMLWLQEAWRNDYLSRTVRIGTHTFDSHSGSMRVSDSMDLTEGYSHRLEDGIFKGMDAEAFVVMFRKMFDGTDDIEKAALEAAQGFADEYYHILEQEFEYLTSEEYFMERVADHEYDEEGNEVQAA